MPMINNVISTTPDYLQGYVGGYPVNVPVGLLIPAVVQKGVVNGNQPVSYNPSTGIFSAAGATLAIGAASIQTGALTASTTQAPNATAVQTAIAAAGGGTAAAIRIAATTAIPLDTAGNGKAMPLVAGTSINITADTTPTIAAGAVLSGVCVADYISSGTGNLVLTSFNARGDIFAAEVGRMFTVTYYNQTSGPFAVVQKGNIIAAAPTFVSQTAPAGAVGTAYSYTFAALNTTSFAVASGTLPAGLTLNIYTGALTGTPTTAAISTFVISATGQGGTTNSTVQSVSIVVSILTAVIITPAAINFTSSTAPAFADYYIPEQDNGTRLAGRYTRKNGANILALPTTTGSIGYAGSYGQLAGIESFTDGANQVGVVYSGTVVASSGYLASSDVGQTGYGGTVPAVSSFTRKLRIHGANFSSYYLVLSLADGSATFTPVALPAGEFLYEVSFLSASATSTLTWAIQKLTAGSVLTASKDFCVGSVTLQTA